MISFVLLIALAFVGYFASEKRFPNIKIINKWPKEAFDNIKTDKNSALIKNNTIQQHKTIQQQHNAKQHPNTIITHYGDRHIYQRKTSTGRQRRKRMPKEHRQSN